MDGPRGDQITLSEVSQTETSIFDIASMWDLKIKGTSELLIYGSQRGEGAGGLSWEAGTDIHTLQLLPPRRSVVSDPVRPHRWQPTRLLRPWGSPGKNTEVGCQFPLQCMQVKSESEVVSNSSRPRGLQPTRLLRP